MQNGFGFKKRALPADLTLSLGTGSATPLEMATAYSSFANGGYKVESHYIRKLSIKITPLYLKPILLLFAPHVY